MGRKKNGEHTRDHVRELLLEGKARIGVSFELLCGDRAGRRRHDFCKMSPGVNR